MMHCFPYKKEPVHHHLDQYPAIRLYEYYGRDTCIRVQYSIHTTPSPCDADFVIKPISLNLECKSVEPVFSYYTL